MSAPVAVQERVCTVALSKIEEWRRNAPVPVPAILYGCMQDAEAGVHKLIYKGMYNKSFKIDDKLRGVCPVYL